MAAPIIDETHDPNLESWVESANDPETDFPIQNLPFCAFQRTDRSDANAWAIDAGLTNLGVRIGDHVLCVQTCDDAMLLDEETTDLGLGWLGDISNASPAARVVLRKRLSQLLSKGNTELQSNTRLLQHALLPIEDVNITIPDVLIRDYTDFYASIHHATNVGSMFRPDNPLLPNYKWIPIGYHGRASSIVASGTPIHRPKGQTKADDADAPVYGPCRLLDYEMEVGFVVAQGNDLGEPISIDDAEDHILGMCLVNDWSARDMQKWEYQPLGPFLAKSFATTVSPYVVTMEALAPFRCPAFEREKSDPKPLEYLTSDSNSWHGGVDLVVEVYIASKQMRDDGIEPMRLSRGNFRDMYWTIAQMLTHHASNGCNMNPGDLLASGTVSGPDKENRGCMLELTWRGSEPIQLPTGEERKFLRDGDEVIMKGYCEREGFRRIGFGECRGVVAPAE
jgi:fumarylacetoacetase